LWCQTNKIRLKDTLVDFERREVRCNGTVRRLPGILADLLKYFVDNPDRIISRSELFGSYIWADSICTPASEGGKTFDVNVSKLRKIIEADPVRPQIIESVRGLGWKLATGVIG
jgi:DNA-binding response OmpR family regulator